MKISVIIPTYKPQDYLWECLDSLAAQTFPKKEFEVLVILNGCCQPYRDQIEKYISSADPSLNIKLIHTDKGGVSNARNIGLDLAQGEFIAFIDDDDIVSQTYLELLYDSADPDTISISDVSVFDESTGTTCKSRMSEVYTELSPKGQQPYINSRRLFFTVWMKLIPRNLICDRKFDTSLAIGEDSVFMFLISDRISKVNFASGQAIYHRRIRSGSAMSVHSAEGKRKIIKNNLKLIVKYSAIWFSGLRRYSFHFFLTRIWGAVYSILHM